jgi:predicted peptidase
MKQLIGLVPFLVAICIAHTETPARQQAHVLDDTITHPVHLSYLLFLPATYSAKPDTHWPLILYLHGGSLRGDNVEQLRTLGLPHKLESQPDFPFVVVSPQCPAGEIWTDAEGIDALLDRVIRDYRIDQQRIYITGHSMGGRGALYFAYKLPSRFAAVLALSPYSPVTAWGSKLAQIPLWLFQGTADTFTPITETKELVGAIQSAGGHPLFNSLEGRDHFILDIYDRSDVYQWLLHQKRPTPASVPTPRG